ncbi:MAG TPA: hypothetical protein VGI39_29425 [Polyangiaceae bacterium]|jgi:hypothetical protein
MRSRWLLSALTVGLVPVTSGCRSPAEITFHITTNVDCSKLLDTSFTSGPLAALSDDRPATSVAHGCDSPGNIGSVVVVPSGDDSDLVAVKVVTGVGVQPDQCGPNTPCIVARRALRFLPHTPLTVNIDMSAECEGVVCNGDQTCENGQCVSALIGDPSACEGAGCSGSVLGPAEGGAPVADAATNDAGGDATVPGDGAAPQDGAAPEAAPPTDGATPEGSSAASPAVGVGYYASCALIPDGTVQCWGSSANGILGDNGVTKGAAYTPQPVPGLTGVVSLSVGSGHVCAVVDGGAVECWGYEGNGGLGIPNSGNELVPTVIQSLEFADGGAMRALVAGEDHTCSVAADGVTIWCWGAYAIQGSGIDPKVIGTLDASVAEMTAAKWVTCARTVDGDVWCWGQNNSGVLGQGNDDAGLTAFAPIKVPLAGPALQIAVGGEHACALTTAHSMVCWGDGALGELGPVATNDAGDVTALTTLPIGNGHVAKVGCGESHTCALFDDGGIQCWGYNFGGALADPSLQDLQPYPLSIPNLGAAKDLFVHYDSACATLVDAGTVCWGNDQRDELGAGLAPTQDGGTPYGALPVVFP